jgi:glycosyltransferase involved in cell wall biosynthesis
MLVEDTPGPLVSIVMPAYNAADTVLHSIESVRGQTYRHWELLIVDDASTDETANLVEAIEDARVRLIRAPANGGRGRARNLALEAARGEVITFLDADDVFLEGLLAEQLAHLERVPECDAVGCAFRRVGVDGRVYRERLGNDVEFHDPFRFVFGLPAFLQGTVFRQQALRGRRFVEGVYGEDIDFNLRFVLEGHLVAFNRRVLWEYRETPQARSKTTWEYCVDQIATIVRNEALIRSWHAGDSVYEAALARVVLKVSARSLATGQTGNLAPLRKAYGAAFDSAPRWVALQEARDIARWRANFGTMTMRGVVSDILGGRVLTHRGLVSLALVAELGAHWRRTGRLLRRATNWLQLPFHALALARRAVRRSGRVAGKRVPNWWGLPTRIERRLRGSRRPPGDVDLDARLGWELGFGAGDLRARAFGRWLLGAIGTGQLDARVRRVIEVAPQMVPHRNGAWHDALDAVAFAGSGAAREDALWRATQTYTSAAPVRKLLHSLGAVPDDAILRCRLLHLAERSPFLARDLVALGFPWPLLAGGVGVKPRGEAPASIDGRSLAAASLWFDAALLAGAHGDARAIFESAVGDDATVGRGRRRRSAKEQGGLAQPAALLRDIYEIVGHGPQAPFVVAGTLLGLVREGRVLAHDHDVDLAVLGDEAFEVARAAFAADERFLVVQRGVEGFCRVLHVSGGSVDLYRFEPWGEGWLMRAATVAWAFPSFEVGTGVMHGVKVAAPEGAERLLELMYGEWRVPDSNFDSRVHARNLVAGGGWFGDDGTRLLYLEFMAQRRQAEAAAVREAAAASGRPLLPSDAA